MRPSQLFSELSTDLRYAARGYLHSPGFTLTALLAIAIGIGSAAAVFSVVDRNLFRPLPYAEGERIVTFGFLAPIEQREFMLGSDYVIWRRAQTPFVSMTSFSASGVTDCDITSKDPARVHCAFVEASLLPALGVEPLMGRNFSPEEDRPHAPETVIISFGLWRSRFGGDPALIGKTLDVDNRPATIVGVLRDDFEFPTLAPVDILRPLQLDEAAQRHPNTGAVLRAYARLKPGVTPAQAAAAMQPLFDDALQFVPAAFRKDVRLSVRFVRDLQTEDVHFAFWVLLGAVGAVLLIACANVANLLLARGSSRQREFAVRAALGASPGRLARQMFAESALLGLAGGAAGCFLAFWLLKFFVAIAPQGIPRLQETRLDWRVLAFALAASLLSAMLFGLAPALQRPRAESLTGTRTTGTGRGWLRQSLAAAQIGVSLVLMTAAILLLQSFRQIASIPLGMQTDTVLTAEVTLGAANYSTADRQQAFFEQLETRLRAIPGISAMAISDSLPPSGAMHGAPYNGLQVAGQPDSRSEAGGMVGWRQVTPRYFSVLGIPIVCGRAFEEQDRYVKENVVILSATLARRLFGEQDPLGARIALYRGSPWFTVIGIAGNVKNGGLTVADDPEYYTVRKHIVEQRAEGIERYQYGRRGSVILRSSLNPAMVADAIRQEIASLDPTLPVSIGTMSGRVAGLVARPRFDAALLSLFTVAGALLAAIGIYGVVSFMVAQRTRELGVRMALGASPVEILRLVLLRAGRWAAAGAVMGLVGSYFAGRIMQSMLYEVRASQPAVLAGVTLLLLCIALVSAWVPARRAARIDPAHALRQE